MEYYIPTFILMDIDNYMGFITDTFEKYYIWFDYNEHQHRDFDRPAVISMKGGKKWVEHGQTHRDYDRPAIIQVDGHKLWYKKGKFIKRE
jgi:hypothetical protein